jgi:hypothetical protein
MELDDLKKNWQRETAKNLEQNKQTMEQLQSILQEKTTGTLTGLKKKYEKIISFLLVGIVLNIAISPFLHFLLGDEGPVFRLTVGGLLSLVVIITFGLLVIFFYWIKYTALKTTIAPSNLKSSLIENISSLRKSLRQELYFLVSLFLILFLSSRLSSEYLGNGLFWDIWHPDIMLALFSAIAILAFYAYKRVRTYHAKIKELQKYLAEFDETIRMY